MLADFWYWVIAVLWIGFFVLEGFDFGVGVLLPWVAREGTDRQVALRAIGPTWDGNEVWLLTAGGATFAAFPAWYASVFSGFYLPLALVLVGLILRGIGLEYRGKASTGDGRAWCDRAIVVGSLLPALLLGVAFADWIRGLKMDANHQIIGGFWDLVTPFGLLGGVTGLLLFAFHGANFLALRTEGPVRARAVAASRAVVGPLVLAAAAFFSWSAAVRGTAATMAISVAIGALVALSAVAQRGGRDGWAFTASSTATALVPVFTFASLWPNLIPARNGAAFSLTVHGAASSHYTLTVMTVVALIFTPIVLAYQVWSYWVFRARVTPDTVAPPRRRLPVASTTADQSYQVRPAGDG